MGLPRLQTIERALESQGGCSVDDLAGLCRVSPMTIRRDLARLARAGRVIRTHGGAAPAGKVLFEFQFLQRAARAEAAKQAIARVAAGLVRDGQSVMLDSGTTTLAVAGELQGREGLTVITSSLPIAALFQASRQVRVLLLGGYLRADSPDLSGALTEANLEGLHADIALIGADGVDLSGCVYNASVEVGRMLAKMAGSAQKTYVVADSTKIGKTALARFGRLASWDGLVVDSGVSRAQLAALRRAGVPVIVAQPAEPSSPL